MVSPLSIKNISKAYGSNVVLKGVSLEVKTKEIFGIVGLNGIGKTTLIKIILDLLEADAGEVKIFGTDHHIPESRAYLSYLPEKFQPSSQLYGREFLQLATEQFGKQYDHEEAKHWCRALDFDPTKLEHKIKTYSKGMGQKLGLISQLLRKPKLLVLDEPMSGLDPRARVYFKKALEDYKMHSTILFSSHILADIDEICDRMALLDRGEIIYLGKTAEFKKQYKAKNLEEAFLAASNL